jgi:DNA (cytosine-5)-methyltransferase 1
VRILDLFSGIGGFSLGLERAGMKTAAFCEIDPYCRRVLKKHWPDVPIYDDVRTLTAGRLVRDGIAPDVICGGFPCQDISVAGKGAGIEGSRSGLWSEYARIIGEVRPRYVIVENVAALLGRGLDRVLGDLASLGYDAEWHCIPASAVGAPHRRDRLWIVANAAGASCNNGRCGGQRSSQEPQGWGFRFKSGGLLADAIGAGLEGCPVFGGHLAEELAAVERGGEVSDAERKRLERGTWSGLPGTRGPSIKPTRNDWWFVEPDIRRVAHGVPARVDRLRGLGNAVVPQIPELIGRAIMEAAA